MQVPELQADDASEDTPEEQPAPAVAPAPASARARGKSTSRAGRGSGTTRRHSASAGGRGSTADPPRRERPSRHEPKEGPNPALIARVAVGLVVVAAIVVTYFMTGTDHMAVFMQGTDAMSRNDLKTAIARFEAIPEGHNLYARAQATLVEARELISANEARFETRKADNLWDRIAQIRKEYVDGYGRTHPEYAPNCRYLLKRTREFIQTYPDDPRVVEAKGLFPYYRLVANLDDPATEADVRGEVRLRTLSMNFSAALVAINEFAERTGETDVAEKMRVQLRAAALQRWTLRRSYLAKLGSLDEGNENWRQVQNIADLYLSRVEGLTGVSTDALTLRDRAKAALAAGS